MRGALLLGLLAAGCSDGGAAATPREQMARDFMRAMKTLDLQYANIDADLRAGRSADEVRGRLVPIRAAAEQASALPYREAEAENRDLKFEFAKFMDATRSLEKATWKGEDGVRAWKTLGAACASCHDLYREER